MPAALSYLVDTNILLRISRPDDPDYGQIGVTLEELEKQNAQLCFSLQNIAEFWNVCTRPSERNGYGLSTAETNRRVEFVERTMTFLPDNDRVYSARRTLVTLHNVRGVQVHDARLAAIALVYGVTRILTLNPADFVRYPHLQAIHPSEVHA